MRKCALIIANWTYEDNLLRTLVAPSQDAEALASVLRDPAIGGFEVNVLTNAPSYRVCEETEAFFGDRERDDLLLYYFSGHGITDDDGQLYYAAANTLHRRMRSTAVAAAWVNDVMNGSRSRRQVLLLDCCHAGAFARTKSASGAVNVGKYFAGANLDEGRGKFILTASDAFQYSFEGDDVEGNAVRSVFTDSLVEGLRSGAADLDGDGNITLDELYSFVYNSVREKTTQQTPRKWASDVEGAVVIAANPCPAEAPLPDDLQAAIDSFVVEAREKAILRLDRLLRGKHRGLALAAHKVLVALTDDDSRRISSAAEKCLTAWNEERAGRQLQAERLAQTNAAAEAERIARQQAEAQRLAQEKAAAEQADRDRIAAEKAEAERIAHKKAEADRVAQQEAAKKAASEKAERDRIAAEKAEAERIARERAEAERIAQQEAAKKAAAEKAEAERERIAQEKAAAEKAAVAKAAQQMAERERLAAEKAAIERLPEEKAAAERAAAEKAAEQLAQSERLDAYRKLRDAGLKWAEFSAAWRESQKQIAARKAERVQQVESPTAEPAVVPLYAPTKSLPSRLAAVVARVNARAGTLFTPLANTLLLLLRLSCAVWFVPDGLSYLTGKQPVSPLWSYFPNAFTLLIAWIEFAGGLLLAAGVASRLAALALLVDTFFVGLGFDQPPFEWFGAAPFSDRPVVYLFGNYSLVTFLLLILGPGRFAFDRLMRLRLPGPRPSVEPSAADPSKSSGMKAAAVAISLAGDRIASWLAKIHNPLLLCLRVYCGVLFLLDGIGSLGTEVSAWGVVAWLGPKNFIVGGAEILLALCLISGLASRWTALASSLLITVGILSVPELEQEATQFFLHPRSFYIYAAVYWEFRFWLIGLLILVFGPGSFALDRRFERLRDPTTVLAATDIVLKDAG